ncbi:MAG: hypothetical protein CR984_06535 [Proteobacteria bacterium]|nr:MAG: hypothetical protein CR984_06535 [Pseudomonadota bacterium]
MRSPIPTSTTMVRTPTVLCRKPRKLESRKVCDFIFSPETIDLNDIIQSTLQFTLVLDFVSHPGHLYR